MHFWQLGPSRVYIPPSGEGFGNRHLPCPALPAAQGGKLGKLAGFCQQRHAQLLTDLVSLSSEWPCPLNILAPRISLPSDISLPSSNLQRENHKAILWGRHMTCQIAHIIFCKFSIEPLYDKVVTVVYRPVYLPVMQGQTPEIQGAVGRLRHVHGSAKTLGQTRARWRLKLYSVDYTQLFLRGGRTTARGRVGEVTQNSQESFFFS